MLLASTGSQVVAAALSAVAAFFIVLGLAMQQRAHLTSIRASRPGQTIGDSIRATVRQPLLVGGMLVGGGLGSVGLIAAIRLGSLTVVQPVQVVQMLFTVPLSAWVAGTVIHRREWVSAATLMGGLALVMVTLAPEAGSERGDPSRWPLVIPVILVAAGLCTFAARVAPPLAAALLGAGCGFCLGLQAAMIKEVTSLLADEFSAGHLLTSWSFWMLGLSTTAGIGLQTLALRAGRLSAAQTTITTTGPLLSAVLGLVVFGETLELGPVRVLLAGAGLAALAWGIAGLARSPALAAAAVVAPVPVPAVPAGPADFSEAASSER